MPDPIAAVRQRITDLGIEPPEPSYLTDLSKAINAWFAESMPRQGPGRPPHAPLNRLLNVEEACPLAGGSHRFTAFLAQLASSSSSSDAVGVLAAIKSLALKLDDDRSPQPPRKQAVPAPPAAELDDASHVPRSLPPQRPHVVPLTLLDVQGASDCLPLS